jgi:ribosomal protein S18 acetylase RimI-like enzyme
MKIRKAEARDVSALEEIERSGWPPGTTPVPQPRSFGGGGVDLDSVLVCLEGEEILGVAVVGRRTPFPSNDHIAVLRSIVVASAARRRGVGRLLVAAAERLACERDAMALRLFVLGSNEPALALYKASGFVEIGRLEGEYFVDGRFVDDVILSKRLAR